MGDPGTIAISMAAGGALSAGLYFASSALMKKKDGFEFDSRPTPLAQRGVWVPRLFGRHLLAPIFCWTGDRVAKEVEGSGGGKGLGGSSAGDMHEYQEAAMHVMCIGPVKRLYRIRENGKGIFKPTNPIDRATTPSGSTLTCTDGSSFRIFWGDASQPVNTLLGASSRIGAKSKWPWLCYIEWNRKKLGTSANWPNLEYEMEALLERTVLTGSTAYMSPKSNVSLDSGLNPAHVLWDVLTAPYQHGLGMPTRMLNGPAFERLGEIFAAESVAMNYIHGDGKDIADLVKAMQSDFGFALPMIDGRISPIAIRKQPSGALAVFDGQTIMPPQPESRKQVGENLRDRLALIYKSNKSNYREMDLLIDDDSCVYKFRSNPTRIELPTITNPYHAQRMARRKAAEVLASGRTYKLSMAHAGVSLFPGMPFIAYGTGQLRVVNRKIAVESSKVEIEAVLDQYSLDGDGYQPQDIENDENPDTYMAVAPDTHVRAVKVPAIVNPTLSVVVLRTRAHDQIDGAYAWLSGDGTSYVRSRRIDRWSGGGYLDATMDDLGDTVSPVIEIWNQDIDDYLDPPGGDPAWEAGQVIVVIDEEVFFLKNITIIDSTHYQLNDLIRGQWGTSKAYHGAGSDVFVVWSHLTQLTGGLVQSGTTLYVKTQPFTQLQIQDIAEVTPVSVAL